MGGDITLEKCGKGGTRHIVRRFPPSPILFINAAEAHGACGHRVRARWLTFRWNRRRRRHMRRGWRLARRGDWLKAYANFDFAVTGTRDLLDLQADFLVALALQQIGQEDAALSRWQSLVQEEPIALLIRADIAQDPRLDLPAGAPGTESLDVDVVKQQLDLP